MFHHCLGTSVFQNITFKKCAAEDYPEISQKFNVAAVPTIIFYKNGSQFDQLTGADPAALNEKLQQFVSSRYNVSKCFTDKFPCK